MIKVFRSQKEKEIEDLCNEFEKLHNVTKKHYQVCAYDSTVKFVWHCVMLEYDK